VKDEASEMELDLVTVSVLEKELEKEMVMVWGLVWE